MLLQARMQTFLATMVKVRHHAFRCIGSHVDFQRKLHDSSQAPESSKWLVRHLSGVCLAEEPQAELYNKSYSVHCGPILSKINKKKKEEKSILGIARLQSTLDSFFFLSRHGFHLNVKTFTTPCVESWGHARQTDPVQPMKRLH